MKKDAILITGASKGIGLWIAEKFCKEWIHVFINYHQDDIAAKSAKKFLDNLQWWSTLIKCDVRSEKQVITMFTEIQKSWFSLESVVVNAVHEIPQPIDEVSFQDWHSVLLTKLDGSFLITKYCIELLKLADNASITYITSEDGIRPSWEYIAYQVWTAGLIAMCHAQSQYLAKKYKIRCNAIAPWPIKTPLWEKAWQSDEMWEGFNKSTPIGRVGTVKDVADAVWYVSRDPNKFINWTTIQIDGGMR